jgi:deoxyribonuclease-4
LGEYGRVPGMFGSHLSIAGGMHNAVLKAEALGCETLQCFTKNQQQWRCGPLVPSAVREWKRELARVGLGQVVSHDSYLINLASPDPKLWGMSVDLFVEELSRCEVLEIPWLVAHPGAHVGEGEEKGLKRVAEALDVVHERLPEAKTVTCLEITAGQGTCLGCKLEHLAEIIELVDAPERIAVCLDTAHLFSAGYDFRGRKYSGLMKEIERTVGRERVKVLHLNDSKKGLGSRVDRHDHIGRGLIGVEGFEGWVRDKGWRKVPKILETPKEGKSEDGREWDAVNLEVLRGLAG